MRIRLTIFLTMVSLHVWAQSSMGDFKVAAIQCYSRMGATTANATLLASLIREAASNQAKIIVLPECALTGYMDPSRDEVWSTVKGTRRSVLPVALSATSAVVTAFSALARELRIYLCLPFAEVEGTNAFNSQLLFDPSGRTVAHHRKRNPWPPGDASWVTPGELPIATADTPYGRLGLMICYDVHVLPEELAQADVDIVLYSIGWYGPNTGAWFRDVFPQRYAKPLNLAVIGANWSGYTPFGSWPGTGYSVIVDRLGRVVAQAGDKPRPEIIYGLLPVTRR